LGADWGRTPAAVVLQQLPDGRIICLDEFVTEDSGIVGFARTLTTYMKRHDPDHKVTSAVGDPSGTVRGPDDETVFQIMCQHTPWRWRPALTNEVTLRIEAVAAALNRMVDGKPGFMLNPGCGTLRKGFAGGYHFQKIAAGNGFTYHEIPRKNQYSHVHDALQYGILGLGGADAVLNRDPNRRANRVRMASGMDYDILNYTTPDPQAAQRSGAVWGDGRPEHLDRPRHDRSRGRGGDYDIFS
jgi:hypothetical protein